MNKSSAIRTLIRRFVLLILLGAVLSILAAAAWHVLLNRAGGYFNYAPEDIDWVLSDDARALVDAAFAGVDDDTVVDYYVQVISQGKLGDNAVYQDSYYRRNRSGSAAPLARVTTHVRLAAAGVARVEAVDGRYISRLLRQIRAMPADYKAHVLARGWRYTDEGRRDEAGTYTHIANAYVWWLAQQAPDAIVPVVSIHPYRPNALKRLAQWAERGIPAVAWWPVRQNINLADPRARAFYAAMAEYGMALQLPVGSIETVYGYGMATIAPTALRAPLKAGVDVIARVDGSDSVVAERQLTSRLLQLLRDTEKGRLRVILAGVMADAATDGILMTLLQHPDLYHRLRYASAYPLSAVDWRIDLEALAEQGFIPADVLAPLREIYHVNPLLFAYVLARTLRLPATQLQLPLTVFTGADNNGES